MNVFTKVTNKFVKLKKKQNPQIILNRQGRRDKEQITEGKIENKLPNDRAKPNRTNNHIKCK